MKYSRAKTRKCWKKTSDIDLVLVHTRENSPFAKCQWGVLATATATRTSRKAIGLLSKTTSLHVHRDFLYISLPLLHDHDVKMPSFTFYGGRKQATANFSFSFLTRVRSQRNQLQGNLPTLKIFSKLE